MGKLIVIILEGASQHLVRKWSKSGHLPNINSLRKEGTSGAFTSLPVPYEPSSLLSAFTGKSPGEHGCFSYWHIHESDFAAAPTVFQSTDIEVPFIWNWDGLRNKKINIVNLFGTHPPQPINGNLISYPMVPSVNASYPRNLLYQLSRQGMRYGHDVSALYKGTPKARFFNFLLKLENDRMEICNHFLRKGGDVFIFNITLLDRVSHFWWGEIEDEIVPQEETILFHAYECIDRYLGQVRDQMTPDDHLIYFSEIGFGPLKRFFSVNDILQKNGFLNYHDGQLDVNATVAMEAVQGSHGIKLNRASRYQHGLVSDSEAERLLTEISQCLLAARNPDNGRPFFKKIHRGKSLYPGPRNDAAPDLIVIPEDEKYLPMGDPFWAKKVHRHLQTGWHRKESIWGGVGAAFKSGSKIDADCLSIVPMMIDCLDLKLSPQF